MQSNKKDPKTNAEQALDYVMSFIAANFVEVCDRMISSQRPFEDSLSDVVRDILRRPAWRDHDPESGD